MKEPLSQEQVNKVWSEVWRETDKELPLKQLFGHRLFIEGYKAFKRYLKPGPLKILDAGGGSGRYGLKMAMEDKAREVTIIDIVPESVELVNNFIKKAGLPNARAEVADIYKLPFEENSFDVVFCDVVIQHLAEPKPALKELARVLKPGGRLIFSAVNKWNCPHSLYKFFKGVSYEYGYERSYSRGEFRQLVLFLGLKLVSLDGFYFAYSIFRLKRYHFLFGVLGRLINRLFTVLDSLTGRIFSRLWGFEIFAVAEKE